MSSFHFCLSAAKNHSSFQLLPTSLVTDRLQIVLDLPLFLLPWGFHSRATFGTSPSSFLNVWPIHLNFLFLISKFISSWPVALHKSLLEIIFGHHILRIYLRHRFTKVCILRRISLVTKITNRRILILIFMLWTPFAINGTPLIGNLEKQNEVNQKNENLLKKRKSTR